jgi:hypothetical protein
MTEWYNHPDARQIEDVIKAQAAIIGEKKPDGKPPKKPGQAGNNAKGLKIVKMPVREESPVRKRA